MGYSINGETKVITLTAGTTNVSVRDLWSRWVDWGKLSDNSKYLAAMVSIGGVPINEAEGTFIPVYVFLTNGWRIKPQEANHTLNVKDGILLVSGGGDPFINTTGNFVVRVNYQQPVQAISFSTGGGTVDLTDIELKYIHHKHPEKCFRCKRHCNIIWSKMGHRTAFQGIKKQIRA